MTDQPKYIIPMTKLLVLVPARQLRAGELTKRRAEVQFLRDGSSTKMPDWAGYLCGLVFHDLPDTFSVIEARPILNDTMTLWLDACEKMGVRTSQPVKSKVDRAVVVEGSVNSDGEYKVEKTTILSEHLRGEKMVMLEAEQIGPGADNLDWDTKVRIANGPILGVIRQRHDGSWLNIHVAQVGWVSLIHASDTEAVIVLDITERALIEDMVKLQFLAMAEVKDHKQELKDHAESDGYDVAHQTGDMSPKDVIDVTYQIGGFSSKNDSARQPISVIKKPIAVEAMQWDGTMPGLYYIEEFGGDNVFPVRVCTETAKVDSDPKLTEGHIGVKTLEGDSLALVPGAWLIKGIHGEFYPIQDKTFRESYYEAGTRPDYEALFKTAVAKAIECKDWEPKEWSNALHDIIRSDPDYEEEQ